MKKYLNKERGVTLIELIISMGLGLIVATSSLQVFLTFKQVFMTQQALSRIQENARIMSDILGKSVNEAGNLGCNAFREDMSFHIAPDIDPQFYGLYPHQRLLGITRDFLQNTLQLDKRILQRAIPDSDFLWINSVKKQYPLIEGTMGEYGYILFQGSPKLKGGEVIAISDCSHVDFIKAQGLEHTKNQNISKLSFSNKFLLSKYFQAGSTIGVLNSTIYYIGKSGRTNANGNPICALYSTDVNGRTYELIEGAEYLQINYGILSNKVISFVTRDKVKDWKDVVSLRVKILLNSIEDGLIQPKIYEINKTKIMPKDRLMRMWWHFEWPIKGLIS